MYGLVVGALISGFDLAGFGCDFRVFGVAVWLVVVGSALWWFGLPGLACGSVCLVWIVGVVCCFRVEGLCGFGLVSCLGGLFVVGYCVPDLLAGMFGFCGCAGLLVVWWFGCVGFCAKFGCWFVYFVVFGFGV